MHLSEAKKMTKNEKNQNSCANSKKEQMQKNDALTLIKNIVKSITGPDEEALKNAQKRLDSLTKPAGSLGRLEELAKQIASITGRLDPDLSKKLVIVIAADHGVVKEGVSAYPQEVTPQMVYNFMRGGAGINVLARHTGSDVIVVDAGVAADIDVAQSGSENNNGQKNKQNKNEKGNYAVLSSKGCMFIDKKVAYGTQNMAKQPAMSKEQAALSISAGISVAADMIEKGYGIIGTGDMGIGNTTASSAISSCICGVDAEKVTGFGTGIDETGLEKKVQIIRKAIKLNKPDPSDGIDVLSKVGGFEIGGIAGIILGCASRKIPVVIDGFISGAGALIAEALAPASKNYMIASHCSVEKGHRIVLEKLGISPLFNFDMRLGEGTGAAIGIGIAEAAVKILNEMATFDQAGVSQKKE
jgi:nicotinate-nucleotide--dimethylbenzimidazole phosphoribosyltransferase